jgi:hypothetical protein
MEHFDKAYLSAAFILIFIGNVDKDALLNRIGGFVNNFKSNLIIISIEGEEIFGPNINEIVTLGSYIRETNAKLDIICSLLLAEINKNLK